VCIVDVTEADAVQAQNMGHIHPQAQPGAAWLAAAMRRAWVAGVNPGGQVGTWEITGRPEAATAPRDRLMTHAELVALNLADPPA
jgi:hypothetical protein